MSRKFKTVILLVLCIAPLTVISGCSAKSAEGFAIYLTKDDIPPANMEALSHIEKSPMPLLTEKELVSYDAGEHAMLLTAEGMRRLDGLDVPTRGKSFLVCVDGQPIYWGAFWTPISSMSFEGVVIMLPFTSTEDNIVRISLGYPGESFYKGNDPRNDKSVIEALEKAGKLTVKP